MVFLSSGDMLDTRVKINVPLVGQLGTVQSPQWADLPIKPVEFDWWDNRTFRLGANMSMRLPSAERYSGQVKKEQQWLPRLAPLLPLPIPIPLAMRVPPGGTLGIGPSTSGSKVRTRPLSASTIYRNLRPPWLDSSLHCSRSIPLVVRHLGSIEIGGSDDRNFAPPVFLSAKNSYYPNADEVKALDEFIENFLYGKLQNRETFTVKASLFDNYETYGILQGKPGFNTIKKFLITDDDGRETTWRRWDYAWRIYNYPHAYNIYYNMYRIAKHTEIKVSRSYKEYLFFAYKTAMASYLDSTYADHLRFRGFQRHTWGNMSESHAPLGSFRLEYILGALMKKGWREKRKNSGVCLKNAANISSPRNIPFPRNTWVQVRAQTTAPATFSPS